MLQADQQIDRIQHKIQQLLKQQENLQKLNQQLRLEVGGLRKQRESDLGSLDELEQKVILLKAAKSELSEEEKKAFEKRLTQYIKEIDRCIALLSE